MKKPFTYAPFTKVDDVLFNIYHHHVTEDVIEHGHEESIEISLVCGGTALHCADGENIHLQKGDCLVTLPGGLHSFRDCRELDQFTVSCTTDLQKIAGINLNFLYGIRDLFSGSGKTVFFHLNPVEFNDIRQVINRLAMLQEAQQYGELRANFSILLCLLGHAYARTLAMERNSCRLEKVLDYINNHYNETIGLEKLARLSALSPSQLIRSFKTVYGSTPIEYRQQLRLNEASRLLCETSLSVTEIAYRIGFSDSNYFTHFFSRKRGVSPRRYRRENRGERQPAASGA